MQSFLNIKHSLITKNQGLAYEEPVRIEQLDPEIADALQGCFLILSLLLRYPESDVYKRLEGHLKDFVPFFQGYSSKKVELIPLEELQAEYIRLFVNNQGFVPVVPYCSYYLDADKLLGGTTLDRIRSIMGKTGFVLEEGQGELEDHLAVLLEFCARILTDLFQTDGRDFEIRVQALFQICYRYLLPASRDACRLIREHARYEFYPVVGDILVNFMLDLDRQFAGLTGSYMEADPGVYNHTEANARTNFE